MTITEIMNQEWYVVKFEDDYVTHLDKRRIENWYSKDIQKAKLYSEKEADSIVRRNEAHFEVRAVKVDITVSEGDSECT